MRPLALATLTLGACGCGSVMVKAIQKRVACASWRSGPRSAIESDAAGIAGTDQCGRDQAGALGVEHGGAGFAARLGGQRLQDVVLLDRWPRYRQRGAGEDAKAVELDQVAGQAVARLDGLGQRAVDQHQALLRQQVECPELALVVGGPV